MTNLDKRLLAFYAMIVLLAIGYAWWKPWKRFGQRARPTLIEASVDTLDRRLRVLECLASWYSSPEHGRITASGEMFDSTALTCAIYRPFVRYAGGWGARLLVRNSYNGRCVVVRVNDAVPRKWAVKGRMLDLSRAAADSLGMIKAGVVPVEVWKIDK